MSERVPERLALRDVRPRTPAQLHAWLSVVLGIHVPLRGLDPGSDAPFDYLCHAFFEPPEQERGGTRDCVVWACRGGGKTFYGALATVLDLHFKAGIEVKILGGSLQQSQRMLAHLRSILESRVMRDLIDGRITERRVRLRNGSSAEVLAQSHTSVRGARPHRLRCDELELFNPEVWNAAQLTVRSATLPSGEFVRAGIEALSTMHSPGGLMSRVVDEPGVRRVFRWGVVDVLDRCDDDRPCEPCPLQSECASRAKDSARVAGHVPIDDAIALKRRASVRAWESEMLCLRPSREGCVYSEFDTDLHVAMFEAAPEGRWFVGMDFGYRHPSVLLWAQLGEDKVLRIIDESSGARRLLRRDIASILSGDPGSGAGPWPVPAWVGVDPAGAQTREQTGRSNIAEMRRAGLVVKAPRAGVQTGIEAVRARLGPASGSPGLIVHARCRVLIESLRDYHYPPDRPGDPSPVKDGPDHACDALRYLIVALDAGHRSSFERYA